MPDRIKILVIAPYEGLREVAVGCARDERDMDVTVVCGNLSSGVELLSGSDADKYDVIISRGETAAMIRNITRVPVVNIGISSFDFMRAIVLCNGFPPKPAIVAFPGIAEKARMLVQAMDYHTDVFSINSVEELEHSLGALSRDGYSTIIGDVAASECAKRLGFNSILLTSGPESVESALGEARSIFRNTRRYKTKSELYLDVMAASPFDLLLVDSGSHAVFCGKNITSELQAELISRLADVEKTGGAQFHLDWPGDPVEVAARSFESDGSTFTAFYIKESAAFEGVSAWLSFEDLNKGVDNPIAVLGVVRPYLEPMAREVAQYAMLAAPVSLVGVPGTGKVRLARMLHLSGSGRASQFVRVNCEMAPEGMCEILADEIGRIGNALHKPTVLIERADLLPAELQKKLCSLLGGAGETCRYLFTFEERPEDLYASGRLIGSLVDWLGACRITLPLLAECSERIPELISQLLNEANQIHGKQVVSVDERSMELLKSYQWPENLSQLNRVVYKLVLMTEGPRVTFATTQKVLADEKRRQETDATGGVELRGTLEDITNSVILRVIEEENGNLSRAVERLQISRSTLWRKLKMMEQEN